MKQFLSVGQGWRTYATIVIGLIMGGYQAWTGHVIPTPWYVAVGLSALGFNRAAVSNTATETQTLMTDVLNQISVPVLGTPSPVQTTEQEQVETANLNKESLVK